MHHAPIPLLPRRTNAGFSLVELLVVVTLMGIAGALSLPKINRIARENKVQRAAQAVQVEMQQAFAIAGRNRAPIRLRWRDVTMQFVLMNLGENITFRRLGLGQGAGYGFTSSEVVVSKSSIVVFPNGLAEDTLSITLTKSGYSKTIRVSRSGMVRLK